MKRASKAHNQRMHAKLRALQRYGLTLNRQDLALIVQDIQAGRATHVQTESLSRTIWIVMVQGKECRVVYDKKRHNICTFLPLSDSHSLTED